MPVDAPKPFGPLPTPRQLAWHKRGMYAFVHFTINTFTDKEWGYGDESPALFNPSGFDADSIVRAAKDGGLTGLVLTAKHHDGFCLWPSKFTEHSIKKSPWKNGKGDMVREFSDACRRHKIAFGVYLSPWDRNHKDYGRPEYLAYYRNQLRELLTQYGNIFEVWFDGANGGDGYYGGARETRTIDNKTYYDWATTRAMVRELQPDACMFSDGGPDCRWVGNESGYAGNPCWATIKPDDIWPGHGEGEHLMRGDRDGAAWIPAEVDVSIRPGWFWHPNQDNVAKDEKRLTQIWFDSVGRGANLILNLPPDRRGVLPEVDVLHLQKFNRHVSAMLSEDIARGAKVTASNERGSSRQFGAGNLTDGRENSYWATDDTVKDAEFVITLTKLREISVIKLAEHIALGQRVDSFKVDVRVDGKWVPWVDGFQISAQRVLRGTPVVTDAVRVAVKASACPCLTSVSIYREPHV